MSDPLLDSVCAILEAEVMPAFPQVQVGKPSVLDTDRSCFVWYGGDSADNSVPEFLGQVAIHEHLTISVLWARPTGATPDLLAEHEYEARVAVRQIKAALHAHAALAGFAGAGLISDSYCGAATAGIWKDDGGALFDMVSVPWEALTLEGDVKSP